MIAKRIDVLSDGILSLHLRDDPDSHRPWYMYLDIKGKPSYLLGNNCGTCDAIFQKEQDAPLPLTPGQLSAALERGIETVSQEMIDTVKALLPKGEYIVGLVDVSPEIAERDFSPRKASIFRRPDYYWSQEIMKDSERAETEIILPLVSKKKLKNDRIDYYEHKRLEGLRPTALAFSFVDLRVLRGQYPVLNIAHFLLDGHHKVMAASKIGKPISILSFLSVPLSSEYQIQQPYIREHYHIE